MTMVVSIGLGIANASPLTVLGSATVGSTLSLSPVSLSGNSPITYNVAWLRDGTVISGQTSASYTTTSADVGREIRARVTLPDMSVVQSQNGVMVTDVAMPDPTTLTLSGFSRDHVVFDTGLSIGGTTAAVPLSGTADAGATVQYRIVTESGTQVQGWADLATAGAGGSWSGTASAPRDARWLRPEVRLKADPSVRATTENRFAAGHVIDLWQQSEHHRMVLSGFKSSAAYAEAVSDDDALQVTFVDGNNSGYQNPANFVRKKVTDADPHSAALAKMANTFAANRPGEKFHVVWHTLSGSSVSTALNADGATRNWPAEEALRDFALADGEVAGLAWMSWYNADSQMADGFGDYWLQALTGQKPDGTAVVRGEVINGQPMDHFFSDMYDYSRTPFVISGPHRFESDSFSAVIPAVRQSLDDLFGNPLLPANIRRGMEILSYLNGNDNGSDGAHPNTGTLSAEGSARFAAYTALDMLQGMGATAWSTPAFDNAALAGDRSYVEVWSSAGDITTYRALNEPGTLPAGRPAVYKFAINGVPADDVTLVNGRVRVNWTVQDGDVLTFANEGVTSNADPEFLAGASTTGLEVWKDYPILDLGQTGIDGIPVRANTPQSVLGVIPAASLPDDPNTNPDLADGSRLALFADYVAPNGWTGTSGTQWVFNGDGTAQIGAVVNDPATGTMDWGETATSDVRGVDAELSFVVTSPDAASGDLAINVSNQGGGGGKTYAVSTISPAPNELVTIPLGVIPSTNKRMQIRVVRDNGSTGTIVLKRLTIKAIQP